MPTCYDIVDFSEVDYMDINASSHIELKTKFTKDGAGVDIQNPSFVLKNSSDVAVSLSYLLKPLQKEDGGNPGEYHTTFLTDGLGEDTYTAEFSGLYGSETLTDTGTLVLKSVLQVEYLISLLRTTLGDYKNLAVPRRYFTLPSENRVWSDGELYQFLKLACHDMNAAIPFTPDEFTPNSVPVLSFPILGGQIYAFSAITSVETANFFNFSAGTVHVDLHKGDKYLGLARFMHERYFVPLQTWKKWYVMSKIKHRVVARRRTPLRISRPLSDVSHYHSLRGF